MTDDILARPTDAIRALANHQEQADIHGERVKVSRQALDEVLAYLAAPPDREAVAYAHYRQAMKEAFDAGQITDDVRLQSWEELSPDTKAANLRYADAMLAAAPREAEWRDMASAPRDETAFLAVADQEVFIIYWSNLSNCWLSDETSHRLLVAPTRWTPLPAPPASTGEGA